MSWTKIRHDLMGDADVARIACATGLDEFSVIGRLCHLWGWAEQSADGRFDGIPPAYVDRLVQCEGFAVAMQEVGWLQWDGATLVFPNWDNHLSAQARVRAGDSIRRACKKRAPAQAPVVPSESDIPFGNGSEAEPTPGRKGRSAEARVPEGAVEAVRHCRYNPERSVFRRMDPDRLNDPAAVARWFSWHFQQAELPKLKHLREGPEDLANVIAAARHSTKHGRDPCRLFRTIVGRGDFSRLPPDSVMYAREVVARMTTSTDTFASRRNDGATLKVG